MNDFRTVLFLIGNKTQLVIAIHVGPTIRSLHGFAIYGESLDLEPKYASIVAHICY